MESRCYFPSFSASSPFHVSSLSLFLFTPFLPFSSLQSCLGYLSRWGCCHSDSCIAKSPLKCRSDTTQRQNETLSTGIRQWPGVVGRVAIATGAAMQNAVSSWKRFPLSKSWRCNILCKHINICSAFAFYALQLLSNGGNVV